MTGAHGLGNLFADATQPGGKHTRADGPDLDVVLFQLVVPVEHEHVQGDLAASVGNGLKVDLLGPAGGQGRRREIRRGGLIDGGQARDKDEARVRRLQQQRHHGVGQDVGAGHVDVVGLGEGLSQRDPTGLLMPVEGGAWTFSSV